MLGSGKVWKSVVDHNSVKFPVKGSVFHITADHLHLGFPRKFRSSDFGHLRRDIDAGDGIDIPLQIIGNHHPGTTGNVQNVHAFAHFCIVQNCFHNRIVFDHLRVPGRGAAIEEFNDILLFHTVSSVFVLLNISRSGQKRKY